MKKYHIVIYRIGKQVFKASQT